MPSPWMKFQHSIDNLYRELDHELVPEWGAKYFDYKGGKKRIKAVARARAKIQTTPKSAPRTPSSRRPRFAFGRSPRSTPSAPPPSLRPTTSETFPSRGDVHISHAHDPKHSGKVHPKNTSLSKNLATPNGSREQAPDSGSERRPLRESSRDNKDGKGYGSIGPSPSAEATSREGFPPPLQLPGPAISSAKIQDQQAQSTSDLKRISSQRSVSLPAEVFAPGSTQHHSKFGRLMAKLNDRSSQAHPTQYGSPSIRRQFLRRMLSGNGENSPSASDIPLENYKEYDSAQVEYFNFLDKELDKIEMFYKEKEGEATKRLHDVKQQLQEMRERREKELFALEHKKVQTQIEGIPGVLKNNPQRDSDAQPSTNGAIDQNADVSQDQVSDGTSRAFKQIDEAPESDRKKSKAKQNDSWRDFTRRPTEPEVPHRIAKRKLKLAMQEFYRGLELLKSYAIMNRTAFRKITKKYDKAVQARPTGRYMTEKVNKAYFVQSDLIDNYVVAVEDLYADYFEKGNHKIASNKLRSKSARYEYNSSVFYNGLLLAGGFVLGLQGLVYASRLIVSGDAVIQVQTNFLLQLYAGYFLALTLFLLFCLDCRIWLHSKINYAFVFEFDTRHNLDWRQLSELPCLLWFIEGLFIWLNFHDATPKSAFIYWPIGLVAISVVILFLPAKTLYYRSRSWWAYSNFRLLLAGIYPVEFRDFFLGDMYCSLTYAMGNIEIFFCLYATKWNDPSQCNSSHSRLLGFFSCLPGIWRGLQCIRRYYDTRNAFPHLANFGKYTCTVLSYMALSLWRIDEVEGFKALFIFFATVNSVYVSVWDLLMDWSLGNPYAEKPFLRDVLGYKKTWPYYFAMIIDPLLRFNWVFYIAFTNELQHSALLSFFISLSEIGRRALWTLFRVENEHCTNVGRFRASRDMPLPYDIPISRVSSNTDMPSIPRHSGTMNSTAAETSSSPRPGATGVDIERAASRGDAADVLGPGLRRRRTLTGTPDTPMGRSLMRVGSIVAQAHRQDFQRKRRPSVASLDIARANRADSGESSDDEAEEQEAEASRTNNESSGRVLSQK